MLKEDFVRFPGAADFPEGPYDLDRVSFEITDASFTVVLQLGWVYDIYVFLLAAGDSVRWELWHSDSAVMHVDERMAAENPEFSFEEFAAPCDLRFRIKIMHGTLDCHAVRITFRGDSVEFSLDSGAAAALSPAGWRMLNDTRLA